MEPKELKALLGTMLRQYRRREYKKRFPWVDNIAEVRDPAKVAGLDDELIRRIRGRELNDVWLAEEALMES